MHIHDLFSGQSLYPNLPSTHAMEPIRTFMHVEALVNEIEQKITNRKILVNDAPGLVIYFLFKVAPKTKDNIVMFERPAWVNFLNTRIYPILSGPAQMKDQSIQVICQAGEDYLFFGARLRMWDDCRLAGVEDDNLAKIQSIQNILGVSAEEVINAFPTLKAGTAPQSMGEESLPLRLNISGMTNIFLDKRVSDSIFALEPELLDFYIGLLREAVSPKRYYKHFIKNRNRAFVQILMNMGLVKVKEMRETGRFQNSDPNCNIELIYTCPYLERSAISIPLLTFQPNIVREELDLRSCGAPAPNTSKESKKKTAEESDKVPSVVVF